MSNIIITLELRDDADPADAEELAEAVLSDIQNYDSEVDGEDLRRFVKKYSFAVTNK